MVKLTLKKCAIYTRKSSEEGLEQDFNSLDAQRESCEAFIQSQAHEGWSLYKKQYDDGGFSGGTLERPALQNLLADIRSGRVNVIVVYKIDRLTRSLMDFSRLVEIFDQHEVSFVSVTQHFNTTSSMGRLTLNVLLSFAQYEREVTGERIRDKFLASRKKGMWMGGHPPLGYDLKDRKLVINEKEAEEVRTMFSLYQATRNVSELKKRLDERGVVSKIRTSAKGNSYGGKPLTRGAIYHILQNPLYLGEVVHKGKRYPGEHEAIIENETWEAVQKVLAKNRQTRALTQDNSSLYPLKGLLRDEHGALFSGTFSQKKDGRRYRYYLGSTETQTIAPPRLPAKELENIIFEALKTHQIIKAGCDWQETKHLIKKISVGEQKLKIDLQTKTKPSSISVPFRIRKKGNQTLLFGPNGETKLRNPMVEPSLVKGLTKAWAWRQDIQKGKMKSFREISRKEGCTERYVRKLLPLAFLSPDIIEAILCGQQPRHLTLADFTSRKIPASWKAQEELFGF